MMAKILKTAAMLALGAVLLGGLVLAAKVPWTGILLLLILGFLSYRYLRSRSAPAQDSLPSSGTAESPHARGKVAHVHERREVASSGKDAEESGKHETRGADWIPKGQHVTIAGVAIWDGMIYLGTWLKTPAGGDDPCLIAPFLSVAKHGGGSDCQVGRWPSYAGLLSATRRSYLEWLAGGRQDPNADIGFVYLFLYGLERRAVVDAHRDPHAKEELPLLAEELRRLLGLYGDRSGTLRVQLVAFLEWIEFSLLSEDSKLYRKPLSNLVRSCALPLRLRFALGQTVVDGVPLPGALALSWVRLSPAIALRAPAQASPELFDRLFLLRYQESFGEGVVLPMNHTKLKLVYRPASAGLRNCPGLVRTFGNLPDAGVPTATLVRLRQLAEKISAELGPYTCLSAENQIAANSLEGRLLLPLSLWPESAQEVLGVLKSRLGDIPQLMPLRELLALLGGKGVFAREKLLSLARALEAAGIGLEPDVLSGAASPDPDGAVVLFSLDQGDAQRTTPAYQVAMLTLRIAYFLTMSSGDFREGETSQLQRRIRSWTHLSPRQIRHLLAHLRWLQTAPMTLAALRKKLTPLDGSARECLAMAMAVVSQAGGAVSSSEIRVLEKIFQVMEVDSSKVFSDAQATSTRARPGASAESSGFRLDPSRVALLQQDSAAAFARLAEVFQEVKDELPSSGKLLKEDVLPAGPLGLEEPYASLAFVLLSRSEWSRMDLMDVASDLELTLEGAVERLNAAAFEKYDIAFLEGGDPLTVNAELLERLVA